MNAARTIKPACEACAFSQLTVAAEKQRELHCHAHPPQLVALPIRSMIAGGGVGMAPAAGFPVVDPQAWCGEFRNREEA